MLSVFGQTTAYIIDAIIGLYLLVLLLRLWLPLLQADFHNPLAQGVLKLTSPVVIPIRRLIPPIGRVDTATVVIAYVFAYAAAFITTILVGGSPGFAILAAMSLIKLISLNIYLFAFAVLISVILSWLSPDPANPAIRLISTLSEPVLRPFRRIIPPLGGFDISPVFAIIALFALNIFVSGSLGVLLFGN
jgi:YggT family protein